VQGDLRFKRLVNFIAHHLIMEYFEPEKHILKQGVPNNKIYYLLAGLAEVIGWGL
jgi:signal-transduction protein with cAMP-binding, CBS, and nucleotidyltransferase domain